MRTLLLNIHRRFEGFYGVFTNIKNWYDSLRQTQVTVLKNNKFPFQILRCDTEWCTITFFKCTKERKLGCIVSLGSFDKKEDINYFMKFFWDAFLCAEFCFSINILQLFFEIKLYLNIILSDKYHTWGFVIKYFCSIQAKFWILFIIKTINRRSYYAIFLNYFFIKFEILKNVLKKSHGFKFKRQFWLWHRL